MSEDDEANYSRGGKGSGMTVRRDAEVDVAGSCEKSGGMGVGSEGG